jgi:hypothetical protein
VTNRTDSGILAVAGLELWKDPSPNQQLTKRRVRIEGRKKDKATYLLMMGAKSAYRML